MPSTDEIRTAAYTQVALAAIGYHQGRVGLIRTLELARRHGLSLEEMVTASGLGRDLIARLLIEADW